MIDATLRSVVLDADEARAIFDEGKVTIRREVEPSPGLDGFESYGVLPNCDCHPFGFHNGDRHWDCPFGPPRTKLRVLEPFWADRRAPGVIIYAATQEWFKGIRDEEPTRASGLYEGEVSRGVVLSSLMPKFWMRMDGILMPNWAVRLVVEVVSVHVEKAGRAFPAVRGRAWWNAHLRRVEGGES